MTAVDAWQVRAALELGLITPRQAELALDMLEVQLHDADPLRLEAPAGEPRARRAIHDQAPKR